MWYILIAGILIFGVFFSSRLISCNVPGKTESITSKTLNLLEGKNDTIKAMFSKEQIDNKLKRLAETAPPANLSYGAKCYSQARNDIKVREYVCPVCGQKTIYKKSAIKDKFFMIDNVLKYDLDKCRRMIGSINGINISLDETEFCSKCKPNTKSPALCLLVNIAGKSDTTRVRGISSEDLILINEFLSDKLVHKGSYDEEYPLANYSENIKNLLGIK